VGYSRRLDSCRAMQARFRHSGPNQLTHRPELRANRSRCASRPGGNRAHRPHRSGRDQLDRRHARALVLLAPSDLQGHRASRSRLAPDHAHSRAGSPTHAAGAQIPADVGRRGPPGRAQAMQAADHAEGDSPWQDFQARLASFGGIVDVPVPAGFKGSLRPYQRQGLNYLCFLRDHGLHGILADDMGLGKTVKAAALLAAKPKGTSLIVAPASSFRTAYAQVGISSEHVSAW
jgi:hypothetical protein